MRDGGGDEDIGRGTAVLQPVQSSPCVYLDGLPHVTERSLAHLAAIVQSSDDAILSTTLDGTILTWNAGAERMFGWSEREMVGTRGLSVPTSREAERAEMLRRAAGGEAIGNFETVRLRKDGVPLHLSVTVSPMRDPSGATVGLSSIVRDVSAQRRAEAELQRARSLFADAEEIAHIGSWEWDFRDGRVTWSDELYRIFGVEPGTFTGNFDTALARIHPDDRAAVAAAARRCREDGAPFAIEHRIVRGDGTVRMIHARARLTRVDGEAVRMTGTAEDQTERRMLEASLVRAERMASLGTLAAGVAHEVNNPLSYVAGNLEMMAEHLVELGQDSPGIDLSELGRMLADARQGTERVNAIVRGLRTLGRGDDAVPVPVDVTRLLDDSIKMVSTTLTTRARVLRRYAGRAIVLADETRLGQVFVNLLMNAAQAIREGSPATNEVEIAVATTLEAPRRVRVSFRDTGAGIDPAAKGHLFDPFFTTKPVGEGTGLGLSICHAIVARLGGEIAVESELGAGACFSVVLPEAPATVRVPEPAPSAQLADDPPTRVLVIDDDAMVAAALARVLRGNDVRHANGGREALQMLASGAAFDVIFSDLMMPDLDGVGFYAELRASYPAHAERVVFMTGDAFSDAARAFLDSVSNLWIEKPYDANRVRAVVRRVVGGVRAGTLPDKRR